MARVSQGWHGSESWLQDVDVSGGERKPVEFADADTRLARNQDIALGKRGIVPALEGSARSRELNFQRPRRRSRIQYENALSEGVARPIHLL